MACKYCKIFTFKEKLIARKEKIPYVSRGGLKIEIAFEEFGLSAVGKKAADVGASTGGFTDFLLKNGASSVITIDVGYGILAWELRNSPKVTVLERTNIRYLDPGRIPHLADFTVVDVSFISIKTIFKKILDITGSSGEILLLVKPQFEVKKEEVENRGIIKSAELHYKVLKELAEFTAGFPVEIKGITFSKIKGTKGNIEYWMYLKKNLDKKTLKDEKSILNYDKIINKVVKSSHNFFN